MKDNREIRVYDLDVLEVRGGEDGESKKIRGHAAVFGKLSEDLGGFREIIEPGAFTAAIKRDDVRALIDHVSHYVLGRNKANTLSLDEDKQGLYVEIDPPDTSYARDLMVSIERGDVTQMSFAFRVDGKKGETWEVDGEEVDFLTALDAMWDGKNHDVVRHVMKVRLYDVSPVTYAAYPQTDVVVRGGLAAAGIDYEELSGVLGKARRGEELSEEEKTMLAEASEKIRGYVSSGDEVPGEPEPPDEAGVLRGHERSRAKSKLEYGYPG